MQKTNKRIRDFLKKNRFNKNYAVVAAFLSFAVAIVVSASLILPAITATVDTDGIATVADETTSIVLDGDNITGVEFTVSDSESSNLDSKLVTFNLSYTVGKGLLNSDNKVMTYQLPDGISIPPAVVGTQQVIYDGSFVAGHFTISETGLITITCTDEYIAEKQTELNTTGATGTLKFEATVNREADNNGDIVIDFGTADNPVKVTIPFNARTLDVSKEGKLNDNGTITWLITVDNPEQHDLGGYVLSDPMFVGLTNVDQTYGTYDSVNGTFTFNEGVTEKEVSFTYETPLTAEDIIASSSNYYNISNTVELTPDDDGEDPSPVTNTANVYVNNTINLQKSGTPDYSDVVNPSVDWTITLENNLGVNLNGMVLQDAAFKLLDASDITVPDGVTFELDKTTGRLTITSDTTLSSFDITYTMTTDNAGNKITNNSQITNSAQIVYDNNTPEDTTDDKYFKDTYDKYVTYQPYYFDKSSYVNNVNGTITWTIVFNKHNNNTLAEDLVGFKIYDEMLKYAIDGSLQVTEEQWPNEEVDYTINDAKDTITLVNSNNETAVKIVFTTSATEHADENGVTSNTANVINKDSDDVLYTDTDTVTFDPNSEISKYIAGYKADENNEDLKVISYSIKVLQDAGLKPQTVTDTLTTLNADGAEFYITKEQAEAFKVISQSRVEGEWEVTMDSSLYQFKFYDADGNEIDFETTPDAKAVKFEFVLLDGVTDANLRYVTVSYDVTADASNVEAGETVTFKNEASSPEIGYSSSTEHNHKKIDYTDIPYEKHNAKYDGTNEQTKFKITDLQKVTIDGVEHYVMDWYVELNKNGNYDNIYPISFTDTLPEGFELYGGITIYNSLWENRNNATSWTIGTETYNNEYYQTSVNGNVQTVNITFRGYFTGVRTIYYKAAIPVAEFDKLVSDNNGVYVFSNTFDDTNEKYAPVTQTQEVKEGVLTKESLDSANSYKRYQIVVNPNGSNLSSGDEITLTDTFITTDYNDGTTTYYCSDKGAVNVNLTNIKVYEVAEDGTKTELSRDEYTYIFDNKPELVTSTKSYTLKQGASVSNWIIDESVSIPSKAEVTITIDNLQFTDEWTTSFSGFDIKCNGSDVVTSYSPDATIVYNDDNSVTIKFTTAQSYSGDFSVNFWNNNFTIDGMTFEYKTSSHDYAAKLEMVLPDEKSLIVEYTYYCTPNDYAGEKVGVLNSVATDTQMGAETAENGDVLVLTGDSSGTIQTDKYLTLEKVDVGTYSANLSADFNLYKYNPDDDSWLPATSITRESEGKPYVATWGTSSDSPCAITTSKTDEEQFIISLEQGVVFKLVEVKAPDGYEALTEPIYFSYGLMPESDEIPSGITTSDIELTLPEGSMYIKNYTYTDIIATKEWDDGNENHSSDSVKLQLYRSTTRKTSGFPATLEAVGDPVVLDSTNSWQYIWNDLPTGNEDGQAYYYYVKELSYTIDGTEYEVTENGEYVPYYVGNCINKSDGTPVKVVNASGLEVEKIWVDADNKTMEAPLSEIKFEIYQSLTSPTDADRVNGTNGLPIDSVKVEIDSQTEFTLGTDNNWKALFKLDYADEEGNKYYYYIVETSNVSGYAVSYNGNGSSNSGVVQIKNKADTKIDTDTGITLPETGGRGTTIFYVIGLSIIVCAVIVAVFIEKRKFIKE